MTDHPASFTPGPWELGPPLKDQIVSIKTVYGRPGMDNSQLMPVALLSQGINTEANARLIAAAPDLYAALEAILELDVQGPHASAKDGFSAALGALSKARIIARQALAKAKPPR